jgi:hypothetical protein
MLIGHHQRVTGGNLRPQNKWVFLKILAVFENENEKKIFFNI